jgi:hypothetical protein
MPCGDLTDVILGLGLRDLFVQNRIRNEIRQMVVNHLYFEYWGFYEILYTLYTYKLSMITRVFVYIFNHVLELHVRIIRFKSEIIMNIIRYVPIDLIDDDSFVKYVF